MKLVVSSTFLSQLVLSCIAHEQTPPKNDPAILEGSSGDLRWLLKNRIDTYFAAGSTWIHVERPGEIGCPSQLFYILLGPCLHREIV
ncbi:MAG: hypothetical protein JWP08_807 [Bryobacterales bacterium]|nr:hypothetical protein [Bryobacterales bacterium]